MRYTLHLAWQSLRRREPAIPLLIAALGGWGFLELADEVLDHDTQAFDEAVIRSLRRPGNPQHPIGPEWLAEIARDFSGLGSPAVLGLVTLAVAGYLWLIRNRYMAVFVLGATISGFLVCQAAKELIARPRPDVVRHLSEVFSTSFPSGHATRAAVVYLTLGLMMMRAVGDRRLKVYVLSVASGLALLVGLSRIYQGVHYPTDVLAGWMLGLVWAILCWLAVQRFQPRGTIERDGCRPANVLTSPVPPPDAR